MDASFRAGPGTIPTSLDLRGDPNNLQKPMAPIAGSGQGFVRERSGSVGGRFAGSVCRGIKCAPDSGSRFARRGHPSRPDAGILRRVRLRSGRPRVAAGAETFRVSPKAFQLLEILVTNRPKALSKADLQDRLWPETFVVEKNLANLISEIGRCSGKVRQVRASFEPSRATATRSTKRLPRDQEPGLRDHQRPGRRREPGGWRSRVGCASWHMQRCP